MQSPVEKAIQELPSRARVGLALRSAERALASLADCPDVCSLASTDLAPDTKQHNAALTVVSALYYAAGEAAAYETLENAHPPVSPLGSDMADVGYEDLGECLGRAADSAADVEAETRWQQSLIERLLPDFHADAPNQPGSFINRDGFAA